MTVEASYVTAVVILALSVLIRTAYAECGKTTKIMRLHCVVEQLRFGEENERKALPDGQVQRKDKQVEGYVNTGIWKKEITVEIHEPEEVLRKIAVFEIDGKAQEDGEE